VHYQRRIPRGERPLEVDILPLTRFSRPGAMAAFVVERDLLLDGVLVTLRQSTASRQSTATMELGSGSVFHLGERHFVLGDVDISPPVRGNGLHEDLVTLRQYHCLTVSGCRPDQIVWAPGIYGRDLEKKAPGFLMRPMTSLELRQVSFFLHELSVVSLLNTTVSETGLWCADEKHENDILRRAQRLIGKTSRIRYMDPSGKVSRLPLELSPRLSAQLLLAPPDSNARTMTARVLPRVQRAIKSRSGRGRYRRKRGS
jgi:hypothetical protein